MANEPASSGRSPLIGIVAVVAGFAGVAALVVGIVGVVRSLDFGGGSDATPATTIALATTSTAAPASTASSSATSSGAVQGPMTTVSDDTGALSVSVPAEWDDLSGGGWSVGDEIVGLSIGAATDRDAWYSGWGTPGMFMGLTNLPAAEFSPTLDDFSVACTEGSIGERFYPNKTAVVQEWTECGGEGSSFHVALVEPESGGFTVLIQLVTIDGGGSALMDQIVATLSYSP